MAGAPGGSLARVAGGTLCVLLLGASFLLLLAPTSPAALVLSSGSMDRACATNAATGLTSNRTTAANDALVNDVTLANDALNTGSSAAYFGMNEVFIQLLFDMGTLGTVGTVAWSYWNGTAWIPLTVVDQSDHFRSTADVPTLDVSWTPPANWTENEIDAANCAGTFYFVRVTTASSYTVVPRADQVSSIEYNLRVKVQNELGTAISGLASSAFTISAATDTTLYAFRETTTSGTYELALDSGEPDSNYNVNAYKDGHVLSATLATGTLTTVMTDKTSSPFSLSFAYKLTSVSTERSVALTTGTVTAGNSLGTACTRSSGAHYCAVPLNDTALTARFTLDGYVTTDATFGSDRVNQNDAQVAHTITNVPYALKVTLTTETTTSGVAFEKQVDGGSWSSVTADAANGNVAWFAQVASESNVIYRATKYSVTQTTGAAFTTSASSQTTKTIAIVAALASLSTSPGSTTAGAATTYTFGFTNQHVWAKDGKLEATFPSGFTIGAPGATVTGADGTATASVSGSVVTVTRANDGTDTAGSTAVTVALTQITNTCATGSTATFGLKLRDSAGTDLDTGSAPAATIVVGAANRLAFSVQPSAATAGVALSPAVNVTVQDSCGNAVTSSSATIAVAIGTNPGSGTLSGTASKAASSGVASFGDLSINKVGSGYTLTASSSGLTAATSGGFDINPGSANRVAFTVEPTAANAGSAVSPAVQVAVQDSLGNTVTSSSATIAVAIGTNPGSGTLSGTASKAASSGVASFGDLSINKVGSGYTLTASSSGLTGATSATFDINPGAAAKVVFTVQPSNAVAGAAISPAVQATVRDASDNTVTSSSATISLAIGTNPAAGTLSGTTSKAASSGVASFSDLSINAVGSGYTLTASSSGLTGATSSSFNITLGAPAKVGFTTQPGTATVGAILSPSLTVAIQDAAGNTITTATDTVSLALGSNPGTAALSGTVSKAAASGVATFNDLTLNRAGTAYTLVASSSGLTSATSNGFDVNAAALTSLTTAASNATASVTTTYTFGFTLANAWPANGKLTITFPTGFAIGSSSVTLTGASGTATASVSGRVVTVTRANDGAETGAATAVTAALTQVTNPAADGSSGAFALSIQSSGGAGINAGDAPAVSITSNPLSIRDLASSSHPSAAWKSSGSFVVSWRAPTDTTVSGYSWGLNGDPDDVVDGTGPSTSFTLANGVHSFRVKAKNAAGTWGPIASYNDVFVDGGAPTTPSIASDSHPKDGCGKAGPGSFAWTSSDALSGVDSYTYTLDGAAAVTTANGGFSAAHLADGSHTLSVTVRDRAGNSASASYGFRADGAAPSVSVLAPAFTRASAFRVSWSTTDGCGSVLSVSMETRHGTGPWQPVALSGAAGAFEHSAASGDGSYAFRLRAVDAAGNAGTFPVDPQATVVVDRVPPGAPASVVAVPAPAGGATVSWSAAADDRSGVAGYRVYRVAADGALVEAGGALLVPGLSFTDAANADGRELRYVVTAEDRAGNAGPASGASNAIRADAKAPVDAPERLTAARLDQGLVRTAPLRLEWQPVAGAFDYAVYASAASPFSLSIETYLGASGGAGFEVPSPREGRYFFAVVARDEAGNAGPASALTLVYDLHPPAAAARAPRESGPAVPVAWTARDDGAGLAEVQLWVRDGGAEPRRFHTSDRTQGRVSFFGVEGHTYEFYALARDLAGRTQAKDPQVDPGDATTRIVSNVVSVSGSALEALNALLPEAHRVTQPLVASDQDRDGVPESFVDPSGKLSLLHLASTDALDRLYLMGSAEGPLAVWNPTTNEVAAVVLAPPLETPTVRAGPRGEVEVVVRVDKAGWIYIPVDDRAPERSILRVQRDDGSRVPEGQYWRESGRVIVLDDPALEYRIHYAAADAALWQSGWFWFAFVALALGGAVAWVELPGLRRLRAQPAPRGRLAWALRHCAACGDPLPRLHRLARTLHHCPGLHERLERSRRGAGLARRVAEFRGSLVRQLKSRGVGARRRAAARPGVGAGRRPTGTRPGRRPIGQPRDPPSGANGRGGGRKGPELWR